MRKNLKRIMAGALMLTVFTGTGCSAQTAARSEEGKTQAEGAGTAETESTGATGDGGVGCQLRSNGGYIHPGGKH